MKSTTKKRAYKRFLVNMFLVMASILVVCLAGELWFRVFGDRSLSNALKRLPQGPLCQYDPLLGWSGIPHAKGTLLGDTDMQVMHIVMNGDGFFDSEHTVRKPPGIKRILFLGDSFTIGFGISRHNRYTDCIQRALGPGYEVINMAIWGWSTDQELLALKEKGLKYSPDVVVLEMFLDDIINCHRFSVNNGAFLKPKFSLVKGDKLKLENVPVLDNRTKSALYNAMVTHYYKLRNRLAVGSEFNRLGLFAIFDRAFARQYMYTLPLRLVTEIYRTVKARKIKFLLVIIPYKDQFLAKQIYASGKGYFGIPPKRLDLGLPQKVVDFYCGKQGIPVLDLMPAFRARYGREKLFFSRDLHWTKAGHKLAAKVIVNRLRQDYF